MRGIIGNFLSENSLKQFPVGSPSYFAAQKQLILKRRALKWCYDCWYARLLDDARSVSRPGVFLELGSGGGYLKDVEPSVITSDVIEGVADKVVDGRNLPFPDETVAAIFLTHVFHHIPDVSRFFSEADRVLVPGGVISLIEVSHTPFGRFFFRNFHPEPYCDDVESWSFSQRDSMMDSNQALSWVVFVRDRTTFEALYPNLEIESFSYLPWFSYLAAGGVTGRYLVPGFLGHIPPIFDYLLSPLSPILALHWHIRIRKKTL